MKSGRILGALIVVLSVVLAGYADDANAAFKRGLKAESNNNYDEAFQAYSQAHSLKPKDARYFTAFTRLRFYAATEHIRRAQALREGGKLQEAVVEFERAAAIDPTNFTAKLEAHRTEDLLKKQAHAEEAPKPPLALDKAAQEAAGPVELQPLSNTLINLRLTETSTMIYKTIGKLAGINVLFDQDYKPQKITVELNDVTLREALNTVALQTKTFWEPTSSNTILVAADTASKRKEMQDSVMKTFYLKNVSNATELQEAATTLKGILDVTRIQMIPKQNALIVRGTSDQMVLAQKLLTDIDKPKPEVVIEIAVLQVSRSRIRTLGVNPPTSASIVMVPGTTGGGGSGSSGGFTLNSLGALNATNFQVSIPGASMTYLMSDSNTRLIQNPEIRALDNEKATLKIGDRVPVATGSFGAAAGGGGVSALVNTQFQYLDVGVNIDITPHIHSDHEVTLKMTLEVSSVSGTQNIGGISQPIIGQRRIEHETRLQDGEVNLVGGILEDTETQSLSGYPWLTKIPILKYLFGQEDKQRQENEIVFAITPHIVRAQEVTDDNLRVVDLGRGNSVTVGYTDPRRTAAPAHGSGTMEQTALPSAPGRYTPQRAVTPSPAKPSPVAPAQITPPVGIPSAGNPSAVSPPAVTPAAITPASMPPKPAPPKAPAQIPGAATTGTTLIRPVNASEQQKLSLQPPERAKPRSTEATADPCPYGMHSIGTQYGVLNCAID